jgi:hypothetical protein
MEPSPYSSPRSRPLTLKRRRLYRGVNTTGHWESLAVLWGCFLQCGNWRGEVNTKKTSEAVAQDKQIVGWTRLGVMVLVDTEWMSWRHI